MQHPGLALLVPPNMVFKEKSKNAQTDEADCNPNEAGFHAWSVHHLLSTEHWWYSSSPGAPEEGVLILEDTAGFLQPLQHELGQTKALPLPENCRVRVKPVAIPL